MSLKDFSQSKHLTFFPRKYAHSSPGLLISTNITAHGVQPTEMVLNGVKIHGFNLAFRRFNDRTPQNTGFENWPHPGWQTYFGNSFDMHVSVFLSSAGSPPPCKKATCFDKSLFSFTTDAFLATVLFVCYDNCKFCLWVVWIWHFT